MLNFSGNRDYSSPNVLSGPGAFLSPDSRRREEGQGGGGDLDTSVCLHRPLDRPSGVLGVDFFTR